MLLPIGLDDQGDRAGRRVGVGDGQRDALGARAEPDDDELARLADLGDPGRLDDEAGDVGRELVGATIGCIASIRARLDDSCWRTRARSRCIGTGPFARGPNVTRGTGPRLPAAAARRLPARRLGSARASPAGRDDLALRPVELLLDVELREAVLHQDATRR